jgi:hypothetical protein
MDFFLWGSVKDKICENKHTNMNKLQECIEDVFHNIDEDTEL